MLNNIIEKYSRVAYGSMIEDENLLRELRRVINYLIDNDYDEAFIISYLFTKPSTSAERTVPQTGAWRTRRSCR